MNARINWLVLAFACISFIVCAAPLYPGLGAHIPLPGLSRGGGLVWYASFLVLFLAFILPLFRDRGADRGAFAWWVVLAALLAFAAIPVIFLAFIAGVRFDGALAVGAVAAMAGAVPMLLDLILPRRLRPFVAPVLLFVCVAGPLLEFLASSLAGRDLAVLLALSPLHHIRRIAVDRADVSAPALVTAAVVLHAAILAAPVLLRRVRRAAAATVLLPAALVVLPAIPPLRPVPAASGPDVVVERPFGPWFRPGLPLPLGIAAGPGFAGTAEVRVAERERIRVSLGGGGRRWVYPVRAAAGEAIEIVAGDGAGVRSLDGELVALGRTDRLVLVLGPERQPWAETLAAGPATPRTACIDPGLLPDAFTGLSAVDAVVHGGADILPGPAAAVLDAWVAAGGTRVVVTGTDPGVRPRGFGRIVRTPPEGLPALELPERPGAALDIDANLHSLFSRPDWEHLDLSRLLLFIVVHHAAFLLVFLLPLLLDSRKSEGVYLASVSVTLVVFSVASWIALRHAFLTDNQVYLQRLGVYAVAPEDPASADAPVLVAHQLLCFASFSGEEADLRFPEDVSTQPLCETARPARPPRVLVRDAGGLEAPGLQADRFQKKHVFRQSRVLTMPFTVERRGSREVRLRPRAGAADPSGLLTARPALAFVRRGGRISGVTMDGDTYRIPPEDEGTGLTALLPDRLLVADAGRYIQHLLGRYVGPEASVLVIVLEGDRGWHRNPGYLAETGVLSLLVVPI